MKFWTNVLCGLIWGIAIPNSFAQGHILTEADQMPYFPGCESYDDHSEDKRKCSNLSLVSFIAQNLTYPETARLAGLEGTVYVSFVVDQQGQIQQTEILRDIGSGCGHAAISVLENMPIWEPAQHQGKAVAVKLNIPIQFFLKEEGEKGTPYKINWGILNSNTVTKNALLNTLEEDVVVRDPFGNVIPVSNLRFSYERKKKYYEAQSTGNITREMKKVARKAKSGGHFVLTVTLQEEGQFLDVNRVFSIVD
ncbi:MAG: energy transducer TonB [Bacteroidota bacterium]